MKLIYIANTTLPTKRAHGLQIMKMCRAFAKQNIETQLVVPRRFIPRELKGKNPFEYYVMGKEFKIKKIFCFDLIPLDSLLGSIAFWVQSFSFSFFLFFYLLFQRNVLIYSRDRVSLFFISLFKKNTVFEVHKINRQFFWNTARRVKKIVVISSGLKGKLIKGGIDENKILVTCDGVEIKDFILKENKNECRHKLGLPLDKKLIIYAGHLYEWKGVNALVSSSMFLPDEMKIILVGGMQKDIERIKKIEGEALILGRRDYKEIPYFLKAADCLVLTGTKKSIVSERYTSPLKMFEYMAAQKPIVASDLPSFREVLNDQNAVLVKPDNPKALAEGIKKVLVDQNLATQISQQAWQDVKPYDWQQRAIKILEFINA